MYFENLISESNFTQSWSARKIPSGERCFLKIPLINIYKDLGSINAILKTAYSCQTRIYSDGILRPNARRKENGKVILEYDYLEQIGNVSLSLDNFLDAFIQMCLLTDFIHLSGFTHRDMKLDNFRFTNGSNQLQPLLLDLDTLSETDTPAKSTLIGTAAFIAPEIRMDPVHTIQSDNYSLGKSLEFWLNDNASRIGKLPSEQKQKYKYLGSMITKMVSREPENRPTFLLDALLSDKIVDETKFDELNRKLLIKWLLSYYQNLKLPAKPRLNYIKSHLEENLRIFGIQAELVAGSVYGL